MAIRECKRLLQVLIKLGTSQPQRGAKPDLEVRLERCCDLPSVVCTNIGLNLDVGMIVQKTTSE